MGTGYPDLGPGAISQGYLTGRASDAGPRKCPRFPDFRHTGLTMAGMGSLRDRPAAQITSTTRQESRRWSWQPSSHLKRTLWQGSKPSETPMETIRLLCFAVSLMVRIAGLSVRAIWIERQVRAVSRMKAGGWNIRQEPERLLRKIDKLEQGYKALPHFEESPKGQVVLHLLKQMRFQVARL